MQMHFPGGVTFLGSTLPTELSAWEDFDGEIPDISKLEQNQMIMVVHNVRQWKEIQEVVDLTQL
jgi:hypothetical protein